MEKSTKLINLIITRCNWNSSLETKNIYRPSAYSSMCWCCFDITYAGHRAGKLADTKRDDQKIFHCIEWKHFT